MKLARFLYKDAARYGIIEGDVVQPIMGLTDHLPDGGPVPLGEVKLLAPCEPTKIVCAGLNYTDHAEEMGLAVPSEPAIFIKPPSSITGPGGSIVYPAIAGRVDFEAELAVVMGRHAKSVRAGEISGYILGYTCMNDVTARDIQKKDVQWARSKSFDTFAPLGPWIETELDTSGLEVEAYLNGARVQSSSTANMIFSVFELVAFISEVMTLMPGDVISTGTPPGIGPMEPGDEIEVRIQGIGSLKNRVERG